ncbi:hypothetical protein GGI42DRAFT_88804 [Trichoderma sp. SZMC 28013]
MLTLHQAIFLNLTCAASLFYPMYYQQTSATQRTFFLPRLFFCLLSYHIYLTGMEHLRAATNTIALHTVAAPINNDNPPIFFFLRKKAWAPIYPPP